MIAALYVQAEGCYFGVDGVDPWDEQRDARLYDGPWPVVAHPPCQRWGRYWYGGPAAARLADIRARFEAGEIPRNTVQQIDVFQGCARVKRNRCRMCSL